MAPWARLPLPFPGEINTTKKPSPEKKKKEEEPVSFKGLPVFLHTLIS